MTSELSPAPDPHPIRPDPEEIDMSTDTTETGQAERWTFIGSRVGSDRAEYHVWNDESGRDLWYAAKGTYVIGGRYEVSVSRPDDERVTLHGRPVSSDYLGRADDRETIAAWEAAHAATKARLAAQRRERSDGKRSELDAALEPLRGIARTMRTGADRDAFIAHVVRELARVW